MRNADSRYRVRPSKGEGILLKVTREIIGWVEADVKGICFC